jgi:serine/threonine protein kinase
MMALEKKSNSRYNLMVDESTQRFLIDSSDEENEGESELNYSTERDNDLNKIGSRGGCDAFHRTAHDHNIEDYEPVVEKSLFVSSSSSIALACKIIDKKSLALGIEDNDFVLFQLRKEIDILRRIQHPHIVRYYDYTETKNHILIITECLSGGELFDYLAKNGALSEDQAKHAFYGVFSAVAYLHDRGVIHRDIKAENVILSHTPNKISGIDGSGGSDLTMKLIDFGFSTITRHSLTESFLGTAGYIAPEIRQHKSYSTSVDDWALGVLVYCALSGRLPFGTSIELLPPTIQQCEDLFKVRFPAQLWSKISSECKDFISSLLRVDPLLRMTAKHALSHPWVRPS